MPTLETRTGDVQLTELRRVEGGGRVAIEQGNCKWHVDVLARDGVQVVASWRDGELADVELPEEVEERLTEYATGA
ncbi:hypothetical protein [Halobacterium sp. KA-6]|uniref:hypothetical protein n=1 Tax=Halobacterium sp. KA-6 TaxID=2896368 RepID=UPI001E3B4070|nr:hypothetical protein [Halobacterium sp. KA-6]MCD2204387.1 hypothetical protein [Halobacterium sp. KA-6]